MITDANKETYETLKTNIIIAFLALLAVVASLNPQWHLWGLDSPKAFPLALRIVVLLFFIPLLIPKVNQIISGALLNLAQRWSKVWLVFIYVVLCILLLGLFIIFRSKNLFLGDGFNIQAYIQTGQLSSPTEPLDYLTHLIVFKLIGGGESGAYRAYVICSFGCGILFFWGLYYYFENKAQLILSLAIMSGITAVQLFFGYVESYSFRFVLMFFCSLSAIIDYQSNRIRLRTILLLIASLAFHLSSGVLIPAIIYLVIRKYSSARRAIIFILAALGALLIGIAYLVLFSSVPLEGIMVPFYSTQSNAYWLLSSQHLYDLVNLILLNLPLLLLVVFISSLRRIFFKPFFLLLIGPALIFILLVDPKLGAFRDWDLFLIASAPLLAFLIHSFFNDKLQPITIGYSAFIAIGLFGFMHTGSWIFQNSQKRESYIIVRNEVNNDIHYSRNYLEGYRNKSWSMLVNEYGNDPREVVRAERERYLGKPNDKVNTCQLSEGLLFIGDTTQAVEIARRHWSDYQKELPAVNSFATVLAKAGHFDEAENICHSYMSSNSYDANIYFLVGNIKQMRGQKDSSYYYLDKGYQLRPDDNIEKQCNMYINCFVRGYNILAESGLSRINKQLPEKPRVLSENIINVIRNGNPASIDSLRKAILSQAKR
jgi:hypothetical protein